MSLRIIYITIDVGLGTVQNAFSQDLDERSFELVAGDSKAAILRITFINKLPSGETEAFVFDPTAAKYLTAKMITGTDDNGAPVFDDELLLIADDAQWDIAGDWPDRDAAAGQHSVRINANQDPIISAVTETGVGSIKAIFEVETDTPGSGNSSFPTWRGLFLRQVHTGAEDLPETPDPLYATQAYVSAAIAAAIGDKIKVSSIGDVWACKNGEPVSNLTGSAEEFS